MKFLHTMLLSISLLFIACANKQTSYNNSLNANDTPAIATNETVKDSFESGKIIERIFCKKDATQSYALYIPSTNQPDAVIYFFDPHGDGVLPLTKYKTLADAYNFILIGSNNSKNGNDWQTTEKIWQVLFNDTQTRLNIHNNRIYACGFSGGAKVASYIALHHNEVKGVIASGAGLPGETTSGNLNFSFTAVAGTGDMNMTDLVAINNAFDKMQTRHRIIFFNGKHEWPPETTLNIAFAGLQFDAMRNNIITKNDSLINAFIKDSKKRLDADIKKEDLLQAVNECLLSINMLDDITSTIFFKQKDSTIKSETAYKEQLSQQQYLFSIEQNKKTEYNQQFQQSDMIYWNTTINDLIKKSKASTAEGSMYERLLAYLSLAFYSISNQLINNNQNKEAEYFVTLYKMADSTNSEAWYFSAMLNARNNNANAVNADLFKAVTNGFTDSNRIMQQPEFQSLLSKINLNKIKAKMKESNHLFQ